MAVVRKEVGDTGGVGELSELVGALSGIVAGHHEAGGADHHDERSEDGIGSFVADEPGRDAFVDDVGLLEEQLPRGDGGTDDGDDEQHGRRVKRRPLMPGTMKLWPMVPHCGSERKKIGT